MIDDLSSGHREFVNAEVPFYEGNVVDRGLLHEIFGSHDIAGVVHLAGFKYAGVSVTRPMHTYTQNVTGMISLLEEMAEHGVDKIVFSSSAATYGTPDTGIVTEQNPTRPESPYGESKLIGEWLLRDQAKAVTLHHTSLRYFNVVGSGSPDLRDTSPHNLFPLVFEQLVAGKVPFINGDTYPTPDGTCVRDYVHVVRPGHLPRGGRQGLDGRETARTRLQPGIGRGPVGSPDHGLGRPGDRDRLHSRHPPAATRRPGPDRRHRRARGAGPGLEDAAHRRPDGRVGLGGSAGSARLSRSTVDATGGSSLFALPFSSTLRDAVRGPLDYRHLTIAI